MGTIRNLAYAAYFAMQRADIEVSDFNMAFNPKGVAQDLVNAFIGMLVLVGVIYGAYQFIMGQIGDDPKEKRNGLIAFFGVLIMGGAVLVIVNTILGTGTGG